MTDLLKKIFTVGVVTTTIFWSVGLFSLLPSVAMAADYPTLTAGQLVKVVGRPTIYVINKSGELMAIPVGDVFKSWNTVDTYAGLYTSISQAHYDSLKSASAAPLYMGYRQGSYVVKRESSDKLYVVQPNNVLVPITNAAATGLYGTLVNKVNMFTVSLANWASTYTVQDDSTQITSAVPFNGYMWKVGNVKYTMLDGKVLEVTAAGQAANGMKDKYFHAQAATVMSGLPTGTAVDGALVALTDRTQTGVVVATTPVVATGGALVVSLAADTPVAGYAFASASRVPFTKVVFTAGSNAVTVDSFKVKRIGDAAVDADFSSINVVTPDGVLLNDSGKTPNSDHEVSFTEDILIPANSSKTYTLVGEMAASATLVAGNVPKLSLISVVSNASSVSGLPVTGNAMTTNESKTLGTVTVAEGSVIGAAITKQVGTLNVLLASVKITNTGSTDTKSVKVEKLQLYNSGTVADADLTNYKLKYNSNVVATGSMVNKYLNFDLSACTTDCTLEKGYDRTYDVYADLTAGSGRTVNLDVQYGNHIALKDVDNSIYLAPATPSAMSNTVTVSQGKLNVTKVNNVPSGNIAKNSKNVELASWNFNVVGEPIDVRTLVFEITPTGTGKAEMLDTLILYNAAGTALIGGVDGVGATAAYAGYATTTDTFTLQPGDNILTLKGTVDNTSTLVSGDTFTIAINMLNTTNFVARGANSNLTITLGTYATPQSNVDANLRTVNTSSLVVTTLTTPAARTYSAGTNGVLFAKVMFDAALSSEDIKVSQVVISDATAGSADTIDIQSMKIWVDKDGDSYNGSGTLVALSEIVSGTDSADADEDFTFNLSGDDQFVVKAGKKLVLEFRGNISGGATSGITATHTFSMDTANDVTATGVSSGSTVSETIGSPTGQAVTVGTAGGQIAVGLSSDNPSASLMAAGTEMTLASFNFLATSTEDVELDYLYLTQVVTGTNSSSYKDYDEIWFVNEAGVEVSGTRMSPTSTIPKIDFADGTVGSFVIPADDSDGVNLYLKAKLAAIGAGYNGLAAHQLGYKIAAAASDVVAKGKQSGAATTEFAGATAPTGLTHYVYKGYPKFEKMAVSNNRLSNGTMDLYKFKVTAVNSDIALWKFNFDISTTVATVSNLYVYDVTDPSNDLVLNATAGNADTKVWETVGSDWTGSGITGTQVTVSKTQPHIFVLRGNIASAGTGASVSVRVAGDSALIKEAAGTTTAPGMNTAVLIDGDIQDDFIWSDKNASGHTVSTVDWTNGYLVSGLSSLSTSAETVSY